MAVVEHPHPACSQTERRQATGRVRRLLMNMLTSLMVNAAIVLAVPEARGRDPAPIVLMQRRELVDGRWADGELVGAETPMVAIVAIERCSPSSWISPN